MGLEDFFAIARAVLSLSPDPCDEAARIAFIHLALRREGRVGSRPADCLDEALTRTLPTARGTTTAPSRDEARLTALALLAFAGDLPDPSGGADLVYRHDLEDQGPADARPVSLLSSYLFLKSGPAN